MEQTVSSEVIQEITLILWNPELITEFYLYYLFYIFIKIYKYNYIYYLYILF
jgi:hypothetical protein